MTLQAQSITEEWQAGVRGGNPAQYVVVSQMVAIYINLTIYINKSLYDMIRISKIMICMI